MSRVDVEIECVFSSDAVLAKVRERQAEQARNAQTIAALVAEPDGEDWAAHYMLACIRESAERVVI